MSLTIESWDLSHMVGSYHTVYFPLPRPRSLTCESWDVGYHVIVNFKPNDHLDQTWYGSWWHPSQGG